MVTKLQEILAEDAVEGTAHILRCLGHPLRLRILDVLERSREATVTEIMSGEYPAPEGSHDT